MNLPFYIAKRYLFSKKGTSTNAINILSGISLGGMAIGTMALVTILSVFNGFEDLILSMYESFNPDLKVYAAKGKTFIPDPDKLTRIKAFEGVRAVSEVIEENALLKYDEQELIATIKGVNENYGKIMRLDSSIIDGSFQLHGDGLNYAVLGIGIELGLDVNMDAMLTAISVFSPTRGKKVELNPERAFNRLAVYPAGVFAVQQEFDMKHVFVSLDFARELLEYTDEVSALEINLEEGTSLDDLQEKTKALFGDGFIVENRLQQDEELYRVLNSEKWIIYFILTLVLIIAAFNMIGSLSMLVLDKVQDISVIKTMGASNRLVRRIFLYEGLLQSLIGYVIGLSLAIILCLLQQEYGLVPIKGSFVIDAYPVALRYADFSLVFLTVMVIGFLASWFPSKRAAEQKWLFKEE